MKPPIDWARIMSTGGLPPPETAIAAGVAIEVGAFADAAVERTGLGKEALTGVVFGWAVGAMLGLGLSPEDIAGAALLLAERLKAADAADADLEAAARAVMGAK